MAPNSDSQKHEEGTFSVEGRVPFVDHKLVELSFKIPFKYKIFEKGININLIKNGKCLTQIRANCN